jgi:hypothetical protein
MGRIWLVARLAGRDLRDRPGPAVLLVLAITAATATLTLALVLHGVTDRPYLQTRAATKGPDVVAQLDGLTVGQVTAQVKTLTREPDVTGYSGPYLVASAVVRARGLTADVEAEGRSLAPASVDQPKVIAGTWVRHGGVAAWATVLDVRQAPALVRALGASPRQVSPGIVAAQVLPAVPGVLLGIPLGIGLFAAAARGAGVVVPPASWMAAAVLGTLAAIGVLAAIPARVGTRRPVIVIVRSEKA